MAEPTWAHRGRCVGTRPPSCCRMRRSASTPMRPMACSRPTVSDSMLTCWTTYANTVTDSPPQSPGKVSQLQLVLDAGVNAVHVSDVDVTRRGVNSAQVLAAAERLGVPLRGRRLGSGEPTVPVYFYRSVLAPEIASVREVLEIILATFRPYPALVLDGNFDLVAANSGVALLTAGLPAHLRTL